MFFLRNRAVWSAVWVCACAGMCLLAGAIRAQDPDNAPTFPPLRPPDVVAPGVRSDVYLLRNAKGEPVVVPSSSYEEYERWVRDGGEGQELPPPALSQLDLLIEPETDYARVTVDAALKLAGPNRTWLALPLGLPQLQWLATEPPSTRSTVVAQSNGYVWRIEPGTLRDRVLKMQALCKMTTSGNGNSIRLDLPSAATVVRLRLPAGDWELSASGGGTEVVEPFRTADGFATAIVRTTATSLNMTWNRKQERQAITAVNATSSSKFTSSDDGSQIKVVTALNLKGPTTLGGKRFAVSLPAGATLRDAASSSLGFPGYRITRHGDVRETPPTDAPENSPPARGDATRWVLDIDVDESLAGSELDVALEWQMVGPPNPPSLVFEVPTIDGVESHSGTMECIVSRGVVFQWAPRGDVRLVRQGPSGDGGSAMAYAFRFGSQGAGISASWRSLVDSPQIRSTHQIDVRDDTAILQGRIEFVSDPASLPLLQLEWTQWRADRLIVLPSMLELDRENIQWTQENSQSAVPLNASLFIDRRREKPASATGSANPGKALEASDRPPASASLGSSPAGSSELLTYAVEYTLSQPLPAEGSELQFALPQISWLNPDIQQRTRRTPSGTLRVQSWSYRLRDLDGNARGLIPIAGEAESPAVAASPFRLSYHVAETALPMLWKGDRARRATSTSVVYEASAKIGDESIQWNHRWACRSLGGRPATLRLGMPKGMQLRDLMADGQSVQPQPIAADSTAMDAKYNWFALRVPHPIADSLHAVDFLIVANSESPWIEAQSESVRMEVDLPVLRSVDGQDGFFFESASVSPTAESAGGVIEGRGDLDPEFPRWNGWVAKPVPTHQRSVDIETEWVQTIVNAIYQRDRYVARFSTRRDWLEVAVPLSLRKEMEILLDGKRVAVVESGDTPDRIRMELPPKQDSDSHVIEIFTLRPGPEGWLRSIVLQPPKLESRTSASPLIWQVIVPRTEHLVWNSSELAPLYRWEWKDLFFARSSKRSQQFLETELGATRQPEVALLQTNQYDLSTLSGSGPLSAWFVPRSLIWFPIAALVLLLTISLGENAWLGRPWLWSGLLAVWMILSQWSWDVSILVAQTVLAALSLGAVYTVLRWLVDRRARRRSIFVSRSAHVGVPYAPRSASAPTLSVKEPSSKAHLSPTADAPALEEGS